MSQEPFQHQQQGFLFNQSAGPVNDFNINLLNFNVKPQQEELEAAKVIIA